MLMDSRRYPKNPQGWAGTSVEDSGIKSEKLMPKRLGQM
jgi:hypothetical protein